MSEIQIESRHLEIVKSILSKHLDDVYVFGSRSKRTAQKFSDLDLVLKSDISSTELRRLQDLFEDSDLPFKVDLVLWSNLDNSFQQHILPDLKKLP